MYLPMQLRRATTRFNKINITIGVDPTIAKGMYGYLNMDISYILTINSFVFVAKPSRMAFSWLS